MRFGPEVSARRAVRPVLIAHGSPAAAQRLRTLVSGSTGWAVAGAAHKVTQALALTEEVRPELILLELGLAGENFIQVIEWMKKKNPAPAIVVLSHNRWADLREACMEAGADYFCSESNLDGVVQLLEELTLVPMKKARCGL